MTTIKKTILLVSVVALSVAGLLWIRSRRPPVETKFVQSVRQDTKVATESPQPAGESRVSVSEGIPRVKTPGNYALLENPKHVYQTFNNCGPATLSMVLSWYGVNVPQNELGNRMRPYQHPEGDNDDKTIFTFEFVDWAQTFGLESIGRANGDIELLKTFTANGIPVVVKTWLNVNDDIGHFRIVRGFDEGKSVILQDDSYHGPNKQIPYFDFLSMWQPFNYDYMIVFTHEQRKLVEAIISSELDEQRSWQNALTRAQKETELDPENIYPQFNMAVAYYHLGELRKSAEAFEQVESRLPRRMLWYQIEPILAYQKLGDHQRVFQITDRILENGNRAFSELYQIRGEIYLEQGNRQQAREQFNLAIVYNENYHPAKNALENL